MTAFPKDFKVTWIPVRQLAVVWPEAQRPFQESWAKKIADAFDPEMFDPVKVTLPNGNGIYHICEGQHRARAIEMLWGPDERAPCLVAPETDPKRAAAIFLATNTHRSHVNKISKFKVAVTAGQPIEVDIDKIVHHNGYRVEGSHLQDTIGAVEALKFAYTKGGKQTLDRTLRVLRDTWSGDAAGVSSHLIKGYSAFICEFSEQLDFDRLRETVTKRLKTPGQLLMAAKSAKDAQGIPNMAAAVVYILLTTYNRGARAPLKKKGE